MPTNLPEFVEKRRKLFMKVKMKFPPILMTTKGLLSIFLNESVIEVQLTLVVEVVKPMIVTYESILLKRSLHMRKW
jgi:hypothetical protein